MSASSGERSRVLGVVPARYGSTRLAAKPLQLLAGHPLLAWVWWRVSTMTVLDEVIIATDHPEIEALARSLGAPVVLTDAGHPSGTDRVAEVLRRPEWSDVEVVVNLQGDEPLVQEAHVARAVALVREEGWALGTCAVPLGDPALLAEPSVVKAVRAADGRALYFSRAPVPFRRDGPPDAAMVSASPFLRHLGLYSYRRDALLKLVELPPSPLEEVERLEQLRALEAGIPMGIAVVEDAAPGVDTPDDLLRLESLLAGTEPSHLAPASLASSSSNRNPPRTP
jgi:3-deoxy-manno-octulosonate cytidylyltransferase (CMP-KDO synthetase)